MIEAVAAARKRRWDAHRERLKGVTEKECRHCHQILHIDNFHKGNGILGREGKCKPCARKYERKRRLANPEMEKARQRRGYLSMKNQVFDHYDRVCACCKEAEALFLTIDHVNNDGGGRRRKSYGWQMYRDIIRAAFPDTFQVLCWNCNTGKQRNGGICPHKTIQLNGEKAA